LCKGSERTRVDKLRRDSSFEVLCRRAQEVVQRRFEQEGALYWEESKEEKSMARICKGD
jgi:hypothetical protein